MWLVALVAAVGSCAQTTRPERRRSARVERASARLPEAPPAETALSPDLAATDAAARVIEWIETIDAELRDTRYQGRTDVDLDDGYFAWDCSGMAGWILRRAAPSAFRAMRSRRPLARDFYRAIAGAPTSRPRRGWQRIDDIERVRPGDLFAFERSVLSDTSETGHVGFVVGIPEREGVLPNAFAVRIADATAIPHADDTRGDFGGFGFGTIVFMLDETDAVIGYLWAGPDGPELSPSRVVFGRVHR